MNTVYILNKSSSTNSSSNNLLAKPTPLRTLRQTPSKSHLEYCNEMAVLRNVRKKSTTQLMEQMNCVLKVVQNLSNDRQTVQSAPSTGRRERERLFSARSVKSMRSYFKP